MVTKLSPNRPKFTNKTALVGDGLFVHIYIYIHIYIPIKNASVKTSNDAELQLKWILQKKYLFLF